MRRVFVIAGSLAALAVGSIAGAGFAHAGGCGEACVNQYLFSAGGDYSTATGGSLNGYVLNVPIPPLPHHPGPDLGAFFGVGVGTRNELVRAGVHTSAGDKGYVLNVPIPPLPHHPAAVDQAVAAAQGATGVTVTHDGGLPLGL